MIFKLSLSVSSILQMLPDINRHKVLFLLQDIVDSRLCQLSDSFPARLSRRERIILYEPGMDYFSVIDIAIGRTLDMPKKSSDCGILHFNPQLDT